MTLAFGPAKLLLVLLQHPISLELHTKNTMPQMRCSKEAILGLNINSSSLFPMQPGVSNHHSVRQKLNCQIIADYLPKKPFEATVCILCQATYSSLYLERRMATYIVAKHSVLYIVAKIDFASTFHSKSYHALAFNQTHASYSPTLHPYKLGNENMRFCVTNCHDVDVFKEAYQNVQCIRIRAKLHGQRRYLRQWFPTFFQWWIPSRTVTPVCRNPNGILTWHQP